MSPGWAATVLGLPLTLPCGPRGVTRPRTQNIEVLSVSGPSFLLHPKHTVGLRVLRETDSHSLVLQKRRASLRSCQQG